MYAVSLCAFLILSESNLALAQLAFGDVPATVNDGREVSISWSGWDGSSVSTRHFKMNLSNGFLAVSTSRLNPEWR